MKTENLQTLQIHKLSQAQFDREQSAGRLSEVALYLTPDTTADFVVEQGVIGNFAYRKWDSGVAECWGTVTDTFQRDSEAEPAFGSFYIFGSEHIALPAELLKQISVVHVSCKQANGCGCLLGCGRVQIADKALSQWVYVENPPFAAFDLTYDIGVKGRWK